jgi:hypothetical protein
VRSEFYLLDENKNLVPTDMETWAKRFSDREARRVLVAKQHRKLLLNLKEPSKVLTLLPTARVATVGGSTIVAVPHMEDEVRVLRNLGFDAPAPITEYYDWPGRYKPFAHQKVTSEFLTLNPRAFCLNGMGSGKTLSVLWAFDYLKKAGVLDWMLVLSPLSTLERAWGDEIFRNLPELSFTVVHGEREKRNRLLQCKFDIYIINHDGIKNEDTLKAIQTSPAADSSSSTRSPSSATLAPTAGSS